MTFHVRHWLARELGIPERSLQPIGDAPNLDGCREQRYLVSGRGVVTVTIAPRRDETTWRLEASWLDGDAETEVGIDTEVVA